MKSSKEITVQEIYNSLKGAMLEVISPHDMVQPCTSCDYERIVHQIFMVLAKYHVGTSDIFAEHMASRARAGWKHAHEEEGVSDDNRK